MFKVLLTEGPVGHMAHPYENLSLSFEDLKKFFKFIVDGFPDVEVTEKLDGQNIIVTYDHESGKSLAIRRMAEHSAMGGIDKEAVKKFFTTDKIDKAYKALINKGTPEREARIKSKGAEIPHVADAFHDAMEQFERAASGMPKEFFVTEDGCKIFYNGEVIDPRSRNIVDYDTQDLVLHRTLHSKLCPDSSRLESLPDAESNMYSSYVEKFLKMTQSEDQDAHPKIKVNALLNFDNIIVDEEILHRAYDNIGTLLHTSGLNESSTIKDYLKSVLDEVILSKIPGINDEIADMVVDAVIFFVQEKKKPRFRTEINPILDLVGNEETKEIITKFLRDNAALSEIVREAIRPVEYIVHNFATDYLKGVRSLYILNHDKVLQDLKKKVAHQVTGIQASPNAGDLAVLKRQIRKMGNLEANPEEILLDDDIVNIYDKISSTVEGLVFTFNGQQYKITGQFAPINQIMGMGRFDRGPETKKESLLRELPSPATYEAENQLEPEWEEKEHTPVEQTVSPSEDDEPETIAIYSGGFKPPHGGHYLASRYLVERSQADKLYILVGSTTRLSADKSIKIGPAEAATVWNNYYDSAQDVNFDVEVIQLGGSPVRWAYEKIESEELGSSEIFVGIGQCASDAAGCDEEDMTPEDQRWARLSGEAQQIIIPLQGKQGGQVPRGSIMRDMLANGDDRFMNFLPDHLSDEEKLELRNKLANKDYLK